MSDHCCSLVEQQEPASHRGCQPPEILRDLPCGGGEVRQQGQGRGPVGSSSRQTEETDLRGVTAGQSASRSHYRGGDLVTSAWSTSWSDLLPTQAGCRSGSGCQGSETFCWRSAADQTEAASLCSSCQWRPGPDPEVTSPVSASNSNSQ